MNTTTRPARITITLSAANLGPDATESDFDAWTSYVNLNVEVALGTDEVVDVEQAGFAGRTAIAEDIIEGATSEERETLTRWLSVDGWDAFCSQSAAA